METSVTGFKKWDALVAFLSCLVNFLSSCCPKQTLWVSAPSLYRIVPEDPIHTCDWHKWEYPIPSLYIWLMSLVWVWIHIPFSFIIFCHWVHPPKWLSILILSPVQLLYFSNLWFFFYIFKSLIISLVVSTMFVTYLLKHCCISLNIFMYFWHLIIFVLVYLDCIFLEIIDFLVIVMTDFYCIVFTCVLCYRHSIP